MCVKEVNQGDTMKRFLSSLKDRFIAKEEEIPEEEMTGEYVEIDEKVRDTRSKVIVKPYILEDFEDIKDILDDLREGNTIALINIKPLKDKDLVELKRAINKLKKTTDAIEGEIAGFGDDYIVVTPAFATIHKSKHGPTKDPVK